MCFVSWFGLDGPYCEYEGSNEAIFALTGIMGMLGESDGPPIIPTGFHPQILGGLSAFNGALSYLFGQKKNPESLNSTRWFVNHISKEWLYLVANCFCFVRKFLFSGLCPLFSSFSFQGFFFLAIQEIGCHE